MENPLKVVNEAVNQDPSSSTPSTERSLLLDDTCLSTNSSFTISPLLDKGKMFINRYEAGECFWDDYMYIMDDGLIATCREASSDLSLDDEHEITKTSAWTYTYLIDQFKTLHDLLHELQEGKQDGSKDLNMFAYRCDVFNKQATRLSEKYPDMRDEINRHLNLLNNKWITVANSINPNKGKSPAKDSIYDQVTIKMNNFRKCLNELKNRMCPINRAFNWKYEVLEAKLKEQQILQEEIKSKGKYISALLKSCDCLQGDVHFGQNPSLTWDAPRVRQVASNLQHRWHCILLESIECQCVLETLMEAFQTNGGDKLDKSFSGEPKKKQRLENYEAELDSLEKEIKNSMNREPDQIYQDGYCGNNGTCKPLFPPEENYMSKNDKAVMVGETGITKLKAECSGGKFEILQDVGYSSETSAPLSNDEKFESPDANQYNSKETVTDTISTTPQKSEKSSSLPEHCERKLYLKPDKYPSTCSQALLNFSIEKSLFLPKYPALKPAPKDFYKMASIDSDEMGDSLCDTPHANNKNIAKDNFSVAKTNRKLQSSSVNNIDCNTPKTNSLRDKLTSPKAASDNYFNNTTQKRSKRSVKAPRNLSFNEFQANENIEGSKKVIKWLKNCPLTDASSCDASGECTTESDSEKSNVSDVNNSVTFSQSFTGSIETVVIAAHEDNMLVQHTERAGSLEPLPGIRLRRKKRSMRDRPLSAIEVHQTVFIPSSVPHSKSESALDLLVMQDYKRMGAKKFGLDSKHLSLTDISMTSVKSLKKVKLGPDKLALPKVLDCAGDAAVGTHNSNAVMVMETMLLRIPDKEGSLTTDPGSVSDPAWDPYQDSPYISEPYSEATVDGEMLKRLTDFGDDYRNHFGSYSDASSISVRHPKNRTKSRLSRPKREGFHSDSDSEDVHIILVKSRKALQVVTNAIHQDVPSLELAEMTAMCHTNLYSLKEVLKSGDKLDQEDLEKLKELEQEWEGIQKKLSIQEIRAVMDSITAELSAVADQASKADMTHLQDNLVNLQKKKESILSVIVKVKKLLTPGEVCLLGALRQQAVKLYQHCEEVYILCGAQLTKLKKLQSNCKEPTEMELETDSEVVIQWQAVQVGDSLPNAVVSTEALHTSAAAEVQGADRHNILMEIETESTKTTLQSHVTSNDEFEQAQESAIIQQSPPVLKTGSQKEDIPPAEEKKHTLKKVKLSRFYFNLSKNSRMWRALRAALPIHIFFILLYCLSCLLEPNCCDYMNNFAWSLYPQLKYLEGPPPV